MEQARQAAAEGGKEIVITGVNIGDFGKTTGESFFDLVKALDQVAKLGAVTSAVRGFAAHASRKIRSAAPLPQRIDSAGIPSCGASFARSARHRGSG